MRISNGHKFLKTESYIKKNKLRRRVFRVRKARFGHRHGQGHGHEREVMQEVYCGMRPKDCPKSPRTSIFFIEVWIKSESKTIVLGSNNKIRQEPPKEK